jgi:AcrR family transcriptional regulator
LLEAAGEVFAERGFRDATVREICTRAEANIAAVNYYFQGKEGLYGHVVDYAQACIQAAYPISLDLKASPQDRLRQFISGFMARALGEDRPAWHFKLMSREMVEPTAALDRVVENTIRPTFGALDAIIQELLPDAGEDQIRLAAASIVAQCLHHRHCRPVMERLFPGQRYGKAELEMLAEHVTRFSLAGLEGLKEAKPRAKAAGAPSFRLASSASVRRAR